MSPVAYIYMSQPTIWTVPGMSSFTWFIITPFTRQDYLAYKRAGRLVNDGIVVKLLDNHGPLEKRKPEHIFETPARKYMTALHAE